MDIVERALRLSIEWSIESRRSDSSDCDKYASLICDEQLESARNKLRDESHARAFVTHFKIELNKLMGSDCTERETVSEEDAPSVDDCTTASCRTSDELGAKPEHSSTDHRKSKRGRSRDSTGKKRVPVIRVNGHAYEGDEDDMMSDVVDFDEDDDNEDEDDDGYRSWSRSSSLRTNFMQQLNEIKLRFIDLVDEVDQRLDEAQVSGPGLEAYRRRRDALLAKLESLIGEANAARKSPATVSTTAASSLAAVSTHANLGRLTESCSPPIDLTLGTSARASALSIQTSCSYIATVAAATSDTRSPRQQNGFVRNKSDAALATRMPRVERAYEEQVHVIDYDFRRRASDICELRRGADAHTQSLAINNPSFSSGVRHNAKSQPDLRIDNKYDTSVRNQPIDFGAMMRAYEDKISPATAKMDGSDHVTIGPNDSHVASVMVTAAHFANNLNKRSKAQPDATCQNHVPSASSTSTYSSSSHTSSSSFL